MDRPHGTESRDSRDTNYHLPVKLPAKLARSSEPSARSLSQPMLESSLSTFTERTYHRALRELDEEPKSALERRFTQQIPARPGIEDDVPEWVKRWSQRQIRGDHARTQDREDLPQSKAIERILHRKDTIQQMAQAVDSAGLEYEIRGAIGDPVDRILLMIEETDADFVVVSVQAWSDVRQTLLSSVAQQIIRLAPCPVLSVRDSVYD